MTTKIAIPTNFAQEILHPLASVLKTVECESLQVGFWDPRQKSIFDLFDEFSPSHLFVTKDHLSDELNMLSDEFDFKYALVTDHQQLTIPIRKDPDLVINTAGTAGQIPEGHMPWQPASNVAQIHSGSYQKNKQSDILVLTGSVPMSNKMLSIIDYMSQKYCVKVVGSELIDSNCYLGSINIFEKADFIKSTKMLLDFGSYDCLDAAYLKTPSLVYSERTPVFRYFSGLPQLVGLAREVLQNESGDTENYAEGLYRYVTGGHTSYHRCAAVFEMLGDLHIKALVMDKFRELTQ